MDRVTLALQMTGHGFGPYDAVRMCRHYLGVPLLPYSVPLSESELDGLNAQLDRAVELRARCEEADSAAA